MRVTAWLCLAENMPSGSAIRPNDVLRIRGGRTVEVLNTDAEGRLVLADGLVAASEEQPDAIVDVATLTGAAMVALGTRYAAVMGSDALVADVLAAAEQTGELLWPMPLPAELRATINSDVADIANANPGNTAGGALLAGVFLQEFVGRTGDEDDAPRIPWAHLDIAGPAEEPERAVRLHRKGTVRRERKSAHPSGRDHFREVVGSYGRKNPPINTSPGASLWAASCHKILMREGVTGCLSRTLTLWCSAVGVEATQQRCVRPSSASPSA